VGGEAFQPQGTINAEALGWKQTWSGTGTKKGWLFGDDRESSVR